MIPAGSTQAQVTFSIIDDNVEEVDEESFDLTLSVLNSPAGVLIGNDRGTVTIIDDDSKITEAWIY